MSLKFVVEASAFPEDGTPEQRMANAISTYFDTVLAPDTGQNAEIAAFLMTFGSEWATTRGANNAELDAKRAELSAARASELRRSIIMALRSKLK